MDIYRVLMDANQHKERTAKVYGATIRRIHRDVYKKELDDPKMRFLETTKTLNHVKKIVNLTRRKNAATAIVSGLKAISKPKSEKMLAKYREIMFSADKDYQAFLVSGKRKRPFANAEAAWLVVSELHKRVGKEIDARRLWDVGEHVTPGEYRVLQAWVYLKWVSSLPPRRLEYAETQLVTKAQYDASDKRGNYVVMGKRRWTWNIHKYKTVGKYGTQVFALPGPLKAALNRVRPVAASKNDKGFVFLNNKFKPLSRSQFSSFVKWVFKTYAGKDWTQNTIRAIKVSSVWSPATESPMKLAAQMGHDITTALLHYKQ